MVEHPKDMFVDFMLHTSKLVYHLNFRAGANETQQRFIAMISIHFEKQKNMNDIPARQINGHMNLDKIQLNFRV